MKGFTAEAEANDHKNQRQESKENNKDNNKTKINMTKNQKGGLLIG